MDKSALKELTGALKDIAAELRESRRVQVKIANTLESSAKRELRAYQEITATHVQKAIQAAIGKLEVTPCDQLDTLDPEEDMSPPPRTHGIGIAEYRQGGQTHATKIPI